jgi:predicted RNA-binding Zn ribbon-like protein
METPQAIREIRILGGNLALDLVNTRDTGPDGEPGFDRLVDYQHLLAWAQQMGLLSQREADEAARRSAQTPEEAAGALQRIRALRSDIYEVFEAIAQDRNPSQASLNRLSHLHGEATARGLLVRQGDAFGWDWSNTGELDRVLWPVSHAAVQLLTSGDLERIKRCGRCSWLFLDATKNRSRRWCSMEGCGTHEKSERFVARRRAQRQAPSS